MPAFSFFSKHACFHLHQLIARRKSKKGQGFFAQRAKTSVVLQCKLSQNISSMFFLKTQKYCAALCGQTVLHFTISQICVCSAGERYLWQYKSWPGLPPVLIKMAESPGLRLRSLTSIQWKNNGKSPLGPPRRRR